MRDFYERAHWYYLLIIHILREPERSFVQTAREFVPLSIEPLALAFADRYRNRLLINRQPISELRPRNISAQ